MRLDQADLGVPFGPLRVVPLVLVLVYGNVPSRVRCSGWFFIRKSVCLEELDTSCGEQFWDRMVGVLSGQVCMCPASALEVDRVPRWACACDTIVHGGMCKVSGNLRPCC